MITPEEYKEHTGELAPQDFSICEAMACEIIHAHTLYAYVGRAPETLPDAISQRLKLAVALQAQAISCAGGLEAFADEGLSSVSLGSFSYTADTGGGAAERSVSPAVSALLPILEAYGRGLQACGQFQAGC